ncbi:MAG TPA: hypothetical protein VMW36_01625 [Patescibacteria group bacterium]|nr:hypothetical protein [Patescibacteria group bacterium]
MHINETAGPASRRSGNLALFPADFQGIYDGIKESVFLSFVRIFTERVACAV